MTIETALEHLLVCFPNGKATADTMDLYIDGLSDLSEPVVVAAIVELIRTKTFLPSIGEIREQAFDHAAWLANANPTSPWKQIIAEMGARMPGDGKGDWDLPPFLMAVVKEIGTWELRTNPDAEKIFKKKYDEMLGSLKMDMMRGRIRFEDYMAIVGGDNATALKRLQS